MSAGQKQPSRACTRCGITRHVINTHRPDHGLCRDCEYLAKYKPQKRGHRSPPLHVVDLQGRRIRDINERLEILGRRTVLDAAITADQAWIRTRRKAA